MEYAGKRVNNVMHDIQILEPMSRSSAYDFTKEGVLESFWANIDFGKKAEETKPVVESKNPIENYQNSIIANMKRLRGMNA